MPVFNDLQPCKNDHGSDDVTMESGLDLEGQLALVPWSLSESSSLNEVVSKAGNAGLKSDSFFNELHEDSHREKVMALVAEVLQQSSVPLSMYPSK